MADVVKLVGSGKKATLVTASKGVVSPDPGIGVITNVLQLPEQLPILLAGPIIRRVESGKVHLWMATSVPVKVEASIVQISSRTEVGHSVANSFKLGERLHVAIIPVDGVRGPSSALFPTGELLGYNFTVTLQPNPIFVAFNGDVLLNVEDICYGELTLPTFYLPASSGKSAHVVHASCRKLHGKGSDAFLSLDQRLKNTVRNVSERPSALLLTGDQIYSDDVHPKLIEDLSILGRILLGWDETLPNGKRIVDFKAEQRNIVPGFTAGKVAENHLLGIGDFIAMYLLSWSPAIFLGGSKFRTGLFDLTQELMSPVVQRIFANIPTYMIFDDHEITDDWNLDFKWGEDTKNPIARRVISNGLGAYWLFQGIGNDPGTKDGAVKSAIEGYLQSKGANPGAFEAAMLNFHEWRFVAPTELPVVFLDTRTQRVLPPPVIGRGRQTGKTAELLNDDGFSFLERSIKAMPGDTKNVPVLIVSPAPFIGYTKIEELQKVSANLGNVNQELDPEADPEAWVFNPNGFARFLITLTNSGRKRFVIFSGDVHYGFTAIATCTHRINGQLRQIEIVQLTSSSLKNQASLSQGLAIDNVLGTDDQTHLLIGQVSGNKRFLQTEEFLKQFKLPIPQNWDLQLRWRFLRHGNARDSASVVAVNNWGFVNVSDVLVNHGLEAPGGTANAAIRWDDIFRQVGTPVPGSPL
jgi:hypothetical protein